MTHAALRRRVLVTFAVAVLVALLVPLSAPLRADATVARAAAVKPVAAKSAAAPAAATKTPKQIAKGLVAKRGWTSVKQWNCLSRLWHRESGWRVHAGNPAGAYGIPQAYPGKKMGKGWRHSATTQIRWGLKYIDGRYDTPCKADNHQRTKGWY